MSQKEIELNLINEITGKKGGMFFAGSFVGSITPIVISGFISEFAKKFNSKNVLDPAAGVGSLVRIMSDELGKSTSITAIEVNSENVNEFKKLSKGLDINLIQGDSVEELSKINEKFDLVVCDLPRGGKLFGGSVELSKKYKGIKSEGSAIMLESLRALEDGGYAIYTNTDSFYSGEFEKLEGHINEMGISLVGLIGVPAGIYYPFTGAAANLFIFKKEPGVKKVFIGKLNEKNDKLLVNNFFSRNKSDDFSGKEVERDSVPTLLFSKLKIYEQIKKDEKAGKIKKITNQKDNSDELDISYKLDFSKENSIYITTLGAPKVKTELTEKEKTFRLIQVVLPEGYDKNLFALFYNGQFGRQFFDMMSTSYFGGVSVAGLRKYGLYYPASSSEKIKEMFDKINKLRNALQFSESLLDENLLGNIDEVYNQISKIEILDEVDYLMKKFPTIISKPYYEFINLKNIGDYSRAREMLIHIVESLFILGISICRGGYKSNDEAFKEIICDIKDSVTSFHKFNLGEMINMYSQFAKEIRTKKGDTEKDGLSLLKNMFGINDEYKFEMMSDKEITNLGNEIVLFRNKAQGHGGKSSNELDKKRLEEIEPTFKNLISKFSWFKDVTVFICGDKAKRLPSGLYDVTCTIFNNIVPYNDSILLMEMPYIDSTYFCFNDTKKPIRFPPLIRYDSSTSDDAKVAFVYSRVNDKDKSQLDYLSYESCADECHPINSIVSDELFVSLLSTENNN